jgi:hypothetical protein
MGFEFLILAYSYIISRLISGRSERGSETECK